MQSLPTTTPRRPRSTFVILGASYLTGNRGVDALLSGTIASIHQAAPDARIVLLEYDHRPATFQVPAPQGEATVELVNLRFSWKVFLPNNIFRLLLASVLLRLIPSRRLRERGFARNRWLSEIQSSRLVLSLAGGDSFSDIYGLRRFVYIVLPQLLVLAMRRPLILLPQTLGPFKSRFAQAVSRLIMSRAQAVCSRDDESLAVARALLRRNASRLRFSHDMAFALAGRSPAQGEPEWLRGRSADSSLVGINVSGLLYIGGYNRSNMFDLVADYRQLLLKLVLWFTREQRAHVVLVSHVVGPRAGAESDAPACADLFERAREQCEGRLHLASPDYDHREIKHLIGRCDFFIGSRMHATIAALSQGVPAVGLAYSRKFAGVFLSVDAADLVIDLRQHDETGVLTQVKTAFAARDEYRRKLGVTTHASAHAARHLVTNLLNEYDSAPLATGRGAALSPVDAGEPLAT